MFFFPILVNGTIIQVRNMGDLLDSPCTLLSTKNCLIFYLLNIHLISSSHFLFTLLQKTFNSLGSSLDLIRFTCYTGLRHCLL